ncbi:hypothetical protein SNOG_10854 [Parastagonospora nodorum SN15]|uniref:Uncharacterized protein n=1 Tax=Phaeosphaeria nodorum (strain SN15 / ATCC MYA-4574 / FGSC 10173) TaxID=321614 RepID=Q0UBL0_PHANO|nr:hypothetical protein SNOG_10854 [Parastagonospora nodorum SN15]EAT81353.1 hypothetical protein SNOG_10854 [Parastagonospora nodorum SN15]
MLFSNTLIACLAGSLAAAAPVTGWTFPVSGAGCNAGSTNCVISAGKTYAVSKTISIGFGLDAGLGDVVRRELAKPGAGASFSFGYSFSESHATSVTVSGMQTTYSCYNGELEAPVTQDFEVSYPYLNDRGDEEQAVPHLSAGWWGT